MVIPAVLGLAALEPLARAMDQLTNALKEGYQFTGKAEKAITALGMSFEGGLKTMGPAVGKLRGTIEEQFTTGVMQIDAGLRGNTTAVAKLINQQMLTGTAYEATAKQFAALQLFGGMQVEALNLLATDVRVTGATYSISTDKLVKAVNTLKEQFVFLNVAGMGKSMTGAITKLQGVLSAAFDEGSMKQMMSLIVNTGTKGLATLTTLGIGDIRSRLQAAAGNVDLTFQILRDGIVTAGTQLKKFVGNSSLQFGAFTSQLDPAARLLIPAMQRLTGEMNKNADVNLDFANTIKNMWGEVWNPIKRAVLKSQPLINKFAKVMSGFMQGLVSSLTGWLETIKPSEVTFDNFLTGLTNVGIKITEIFMHIGLTIKNVFFTIVFPMFTKLAMSIGLLINEIKRALHELNPKTWIAKEIQSPFDYIAGWMEVIPGGAWQAMLLRETGRNIAEWTTGKSAEFISTLGEGIEGAATMLGADLGEFGKAQAEIPNQIKGVTDKLREVQLTIQGNSEAWRANNNYLFGIEDSVASIDDKTPDPRDTAAGYLSLTERFLETSMNEILGIRGTDEFGLIVDRLDDLILFEEEKAAGGGISTRVPPLPD